MVCFTHPTIKHQSTREVFAVEPTGESALAKVAANPENRRLSQRNRVFRPVRIGIGGSLAAPPLPHHRAYGSVHGGSTAYVLIIVRSWGTPRPAKNLTVKAS